MNRNRLVPVVVAGILLVSVVLLGAAALRAGREEVSPGVIASDPQPVTASMLHFSLKDMIGHADRIFRGTVVDTSPGTVTVGGRALPMVIYRLQVVEAFKGNFERKGDVQVVEIHMVGNLKEVAASGNLRKFSALPDPPQLRVGSDYLLLTTPLSAVGLSTTVGLGQGSFEIFTLDKQEWARNEFNNAGLFEGPVPYTELAEKIQQLVS